MAAAGNVVTLSEPIGGTIDAVLAAIRDHGVHGVCARREASPYPSSGESPWLLVPQDDVDVAFLQSRSLSAPPAITNEAKVLFPRDGFTKKDIIGYYDSISEVLLPHLADRPVVCQRWPDGIDEFTWYQHRIPPRAPDYLRGVWIEGNHRILLSNKESLLWIVNQAALTLHGWSSRTGRLAEPDWVTIDLDPGENTRWEDVIDVAIAVRKLLELLELESVPKTSGQRGLHVLIPIAPRHSVAQAQECARRIALMIARLMPDKVTLESTKEKRRGRLYLDHVQSFVGKSLVLSYSLRAVDGAPVSTPLSWSEVGPGLDPKTLTLRSVRARIDAMGDLAAPLLTGRAQLVPVLGRLLE
jgi:bifunctional non-homologous end joining protein LigD